MRRLGGPLRSCIHRPFHRMSVGRLQVRRVLDRIASERGLPEAIVLDNGPEFCGRALAVWSEGQGYRFALRVASHMRRRDKPRETPAPSQTDIASGKVKGDYGYVALSRVGFNGKGTQALFTSTIFVHCVAAAVTC